MWASPIYNLLDAVQDDGVCCVMNLHLPCCVRSDISSTFRTWQQIARAVSARARLDDDKTTTYVTIVTALLGTVRTRLTDSPR